MFTTGSKLFLGATTLAVVGAVVNAATTDGPAGFMGTVGLIAAAVVFAFLAGVNFYIRDGNVPAMQQGAQYTAAAAQPPAGRSAWPAVAALGTAGLAVGTVSHPVVFKVSVVVLLAAIVEWMVQGWSERASADAEYNAGIRRRVLHPLEFPILAAVGVGALIYAFSRIMLSADKDAGLLIFIIIATLILVAAFILAYRRGVAKATIAGICAIAGLALLGVGVASAVQGQREIEEHHGLTREVCLEEATAEEMKHADEDADTGVSAQAGIVANVTLQSNGVVIAENAARPGDDDLSEITVPRSSQVSILFRNEYDGEHRLTARLGTFGDATEDTVVCTARIAEGDTQFLSFSIPKTNDASSTPLELIIPDLPGQSIKLLVP